MRSRKPGYSHSAILILGLCAMCILTAGCDPQEVRTRWADRPINIDGDTKDWTSIPTSYLSDSAVQLGLRNDAENLYILLSSVDPRWAISIRFGSLTLWFDTTGEKQKQHGIRFKGGVSPVEMFEQLSADEERFRDMSDDEHPEQEMEHQSFSEFTMVGKDDIEIPLDQHGSGGPAVGFGVPKGAYVYEFSIPLPHSDTASFALGAQPGDPVAIGIEWGDVDRDAMNDHMSAMRDEMGNKGGGTNGRRMSGGLGSRPGRAGMMTYQDELWVTTVLAKNL